MNEDRVEQIVRSPVRPVVTLAFAGAFIYGFIYGLVSADAFLGVAVFVIKSWFDGREKEKNGG